MDPVEFGGHLPITTVMWYFDTHLFYLKQDKSFKPAFVFIDHQPDLVCKIAAIEPDSRMYLLGVTSDNLSDWVNRVQTQLNHVLTQESKLHASGDWDQQANWAVAGADAVGIPKRCGRGGGGVWHKDGDTQRLVVRRDVKVDGASGINSYLGVPVTQGVTRHQESSCSVSLNSILCVPVSSGCRTLRQPVLSESLSWLGAMDRQRFN